MKVNIRYKYRITKVSYYILHKLDRLYRECLHNLNHDIDSYILRITYKEGLTTRKIEKCIYCESLEELYEEESLERMSLDLIKDDFKRNYEDNKREKMKSKILKRLNKNSGWRTAAIEIETGDKS